MVFNFVTIDLSDDPVDFAALFPPETPSTTSCDCTCTCTKTIVARVRASASRVLTVPAINADGAGPSDPLPAINADCAGPGNPIPAVNTDCVGPSNPLPAVNTNCAGPSNPLDILDVIPKSDLRRFTINELQVATCNFSEKFIVGKGGFGNVYKALLPDGSFVAIKRLARTSYQGLKEFETEIEISSRVKHPNLAPAIGFCVSNEPQENILVYLFKVNGNLRSCLEKIQSQPPLNWLTRKRIMLGAARGLLHLHENRIIHRDIKASNILLDENLDAWIGDFGIAMILDKYNQQVPPYEVQNHTVFRFTADREMATNCSIHENTEITTTVRGTLGHIAPEYLAIRKCSMKNDVFAFGVTILEVVTGRSASKLARCSDGEDDMLQRLVRSFLESNMIDRVIDPNIRSSYNKDDVEKIIQLSFACTLSSPEKRPSMLQVVQVLEGASLRDIGIGRDGITMAAPQQEPERIMMAKREQEPKPETWVVDDSISILASEVLSGPR